ncbi:alpha/beta hydrolase [Luteolibacter arcticus]|uniref:Alpha/beta hydrolase n=1 Tax=Luteolibacter arcticus TaxID=1581411 RepID=A0ABT3GNT2_9BACT|nr:alpha/beta hydrolase [Luteolibacter arcticus]MCW1925157.1 alpha/beta hydrolase [Luteolibacter arcticus]
MKSHYRLLPPSVRLLTTAMMVGASIAQTEELVPDSESAARKLERETEIIEPSPGAAAARPVGKPDAQMQAVLDELAALGGKPLVSLKPEDAREQPTPANAVRKVMGKQDKKGPEEVAKVDDIDLELTGHDVKGRIYKPEGDGPHPVILYIHGGGWVIADLDTYDATPRALCNATNALVISTHYRQAPEHKFPAAHEDVFGAYQWAMKNAGRWGGDASRIAVVGESAGGNMAVALSMMAQDKGMQMPVHQVLVYPVADTSMSSESYRQHADAKPLNAALMKWFFDHTLSKQEDWKNHQINLLAAESLKGLPSTTVITADIDPLRSEGEALANKLEKDGVPVERRNFEGVTHEFFGMGAVVDKAGEAMGFAAENLKEAFAGKQPGVAAPKPAAEAPPVD